MKNKILSEKANKRRLTIVVVRNFGRIRTIHISSRLIIFICSIFCITLLSSGFFAYQNNSLRLERQRLLAQVFLPESIESSTSENLEESVYQSPEAYNQNEYEEDADSDSFTDNMTDSIDNEESKQAEEEESAPVQITSNETVPTPSTTLLTTTTTSSTTTTTTTTLPIEEDRIDPENIDISEYKVQKLNKPNGLRISFKILNNGKSGKKINGYVFVVAGDTSLDSPEYKAFPKDSIFSQNRPINHKQGRYFSIRQFTTIRARIYAKNIFNSVEILAYDASGRLVLSRTFEVESD